ncbi:MAG: phosphate/phosphite/phosphonate ABC transporter substrate-binding protein [Thermodesulfobacteriota bacterium]
MQERKIEQKRYRESMKTARAITGFFIFLFIGILTAGGCTTNEETVIGKKAAPETVEDKREVLKLTVQPCWSPRDSFTMFTPLADYLSRETGLNIKLVVLETEKDFHEALDTAAFTLQDAFSIYVHNKKIALFDPLAIAVSGDGKTEERGVIIVRADSSIKGLSDLKGKTFLFGAPHNTPKFTGAYITLKEAGIDPGRDLKGHEFGGDCDDNAMSVFLGEYDAGAVCKDFVEGPEGKKRFNFKTDLRIVADTVPLPSWMLAASKDVDREVVEKVRNALLKIGPRSPLAEEVLKECEWSGFIAVTGKELSRIDNLVRKYSIPVR